MAITKTVNLAQSARLAALLVAMFCAANGEEWSRFRGPNGSGIGKGTGYPTEFGPGKNLQWRTPVRPGKSSPVLTENLVFLTAFDEGKLFTQCFDRSNGKLLWERAVEREREADLNQLNEPSSMSPVTDGENVFVFFRDVGLISYDSAGRQRWQTPLGPLSNSMGQGSSPILADGLLIVQADHRGDSYLAALNPSNGEMKWKTERHESEGWATPVIWKQADGTNQIITASRGWFAGHRLDDGRRVWERNSLSPAVVASPVISANRAFVFGYGNDANSDFDGAFDARDADADGRLTRDEYGTHAFMVATAKYEGDRDQILTRQEWLDAARATVAPSSLVSFDLEGAAVAEGGSAKGPDECWRYERSFVGVIPSALVYGNVIYLIKNGGIFETLDASTGQPLQQGRIREAIEGFSASPVAADGKVYFASEGGKVAVAKATGDWEIIAVNDLEEEIFATPALSGGHIFVRTGKALYAFGELK